MILVKNLSANPADTKRWINVGLTSCVCWEVSKKLSTSGLQPAYLKDHVSFDSVTSQFDGPIRHSLEWWTLSESSFAGL